MRRWLGLVVVADLAVGTAGAIERIYLYVAHAGYETRLQRLQANCDLSIQPPP